MPISTEHLRIWKHSHGTYKTTGWSDDVREELKADRVLMIGQYLEERQVKNFKMMQPGDFFYLCHGNNVQLLGQVKSGIINPRARSLSREYVTICPLPPGPWKFTRHSKAWSPKGNTTCWQVPKQEHSAFQNDVLREFFGMTLSDLAKWAKPTRSQSEIESAELPPPLGNPRPYKRSRGRRPSKGTGRSVRLYDPDKTGRRADMHEECLDRLARLLRKGGTCHLKKYDYDLVVVRKNKALLVEAKTLRGDAVHQLRLALGQLLFYQHQFVERQFPRRNVLRVALTDRVPPDYLVRILERYKVGVVWVPERQKTFASKLGRRFLKVFGIIL